MSAQTAQILLGVIIAFLIFKGYDYFKPRVISYFEYQREAIRRRKILRNKFDIGEVVCHDYIITKIIKVVYIKEGTQPVKIFYNLENFDYLIPESEIIPLEKTYQKTGVIK